MNPPCSVQSILAVDCGSTTTKAILFEKIDGEFRLSATGEAPTTVEAPFDDVTIGVLNAILEIQEAVGRPLLTSNDESLMKPRKGDAGVDIFIATSSAGGGLQMMAAGVVKNMSAESATRAALGAGAVVTEVSAANDRFPAHQKIQRIRRLRPDMILLSGGIDGGNTAQVVEMAEIIAAADPHARLGTTFQLPLLYAGNRDALPLVKGIIGEKFALDIADNIRPALEEENLMPARRKIQRLFLDHVMSHAPGYAKLLEMADSPVMPTPAAVGDMMRLVAKSTGFNIVGVDIGGATTDVFSVFDGRYHKTVSANLGMSYSIGNVLSETGSEAICRWLPFSPDEGSLHDRLWNKMVRPTTIPATWEDLILEQACAREALRLSFEQHCSLAIGLKGIRRERTVGEILDRALGEESRIDRKKIGLLIASGGVLSHAPRRQQAALMLLDAFQPEGITRLAVDSIFMMPHLGALAALDEPISIKLLENDCLLWLGTCIAPWGEGSPGSAALKATIRYSNDACTEYIFAFGGINVLPLPWPETAELVIKPAPGLDLGNGSGELVKLEAKGGVVGLIFDLRGRPLRFPKEPNECRLLVKGWYNSMQCIPKNS